MGLTQVTYSMIKGAVVNVDDLIPPDFDYTNDDAAPYIQEALDTGKDVVFTQPAYRIESSLTIGSQRVTGGVSTTSVGRYQTRLNVIGNIPCFVNGPGEISFEIDGFYIYYGNTTPTTSTGNDQKIAFKFTQNTLWPAYSEIRNCTVLGAWQGYYDDTGTYLTKLTQVACRYTKRGFYKYSGTTIEFDTCSSSDGDQGFVLDTVLSPVLINCSADGLTVTALTNEQAGNYFHNITSLTIHGWDGESNSISGDTSAYFKFRNTTATITGFTGALNTLSGSGTEETYFFYCIDNSNVTVTGFKVNRETDWLKYVGTGGKCFTLKADNTGYVVLIGSIFKAPVDGAPTERWSVAGFGGATITTINTLVDNLYSIDMFSRDGLLTASDSFDAPLYYVEDATIRTGTGTPEGVVTANPGSLFLRTDGGATTTLYVKTSGVGTNTGWTAK